MNQLKPNRLFNILFAAIILMATLFSLQACSNKSSSSKSAKGALNTSPPANEPAPTVVAAAEEKEGMQIKRDASGNFVIQLLLKDLQPVKLMKPVKEGYVVWVTTEANIPNSIGIIEGANTWTDKKDKVKFEAAYPVKPVKVFITAESDLKTQKPGTQVVWSTKNF